MAEELPPTNPLSPEVQNILERLERGEHFFAAEAGNVPTDELLALGPEKARELKEAIEAKFQANWNAYLDAPEARPIRAHDQLEPLEEVFRRPHEERLAAKLAERNRPLLEKFGEIDEYLHNAYESEPKTGIFNNIETAKELTARAAARGDLPVAPTIEELLWTAKEGNLSASDHALVKHGPDLTDKLATRINEELERARSKQPSLNFGWLTPSEVENLKNTHTALAAAKAETRYSYSAAGVGKAIKEKMSALDSELVKAQQGLHAHRIFGDFEAAVKAGDRNGAAQKLYGMNDAQVSEIERRFRDLRHKAQAHKVFDDILETKRNVNAVLARVDVPDWTIDLKKEFRNDDHRITDLWHELNLHPQANNFEHPIGQARTWLDQLFHFTSNDPAHIADCFDTHRMNILCEEFVGTQAKRMDRASWSHLKGLTNHQLAKVESRLADLKAVPENNAPIVVKYFDSLESLLKDKKQVNSLLERVTKGEALHNDEITALARRKGVMKEFWKRLEAHPQASGENALPSVEATLGYLKGAGADKAEALKNLHIQAKTAQRKIRSIAKRVGQGKEAVKILPPALEGGEPVYQVADEVVALGEHGAEELRGLCRTLESAHRQRYDQWYADVLKAAGKDSLTPEELTKFLGTLNENHSLRAWQRDFAQRERAFGISDYLVHSLGKNTGPYNSEEAAAAAKRFAERSAVVDRKVDNILARVEMGEQFVHNHKGTAKLADELVEEGPRVAYRLKKKVSAKVKNANQAFDKAVAANLTPEAAEVVQGEFLATTKKFGSLDDSLRMAHVSRQGPFDSAAVEAVRSRVRSEPNLNHFLRAAKDGHLEITDPRLVEHGPDFAEKFLWETIPAERDAFALDRVSPNLGVQLTKQEIENLEAVKGKLWPAHSEVVNLKAVHGEKWATYINKSKGTSFDPAAVKKATRKKISVAGPYLNEAKRIETEELAAAPAREADRLWKLAVSPKARMQILEDEIMSGKVLEATDWRIAQKGGLGYTEKDIYENANAFWKRLEKKLKSVDRVPGIDMEPAASEEVLNALRGTIQNLSDARLAKTGPFPKHLVEQMEKSLPDKISTAVVEAPRKMVDAVKHVIWGDTPAAAEAPKTSGGSFYYGGSSEAEKGKFARFWEEGHWVGKKGLAVAAGVTAVGTLFYAATNRSETKKREGSWADQVTAATDPTQQQSR